MLFCFLPGMFASSRVTKLKVTFSEPGCLQQIGLSQSLPHSGRGAKKIKKESRERKKEAIITHQRCSLKQKHSFSPKDLQVGGDR